VVADKNLKRAEEAAGSFLRSYARAPLRPTPSVESREKNQPPRTSSTPCSSSFSFRSDGRGLASGSSFPLRDGVSSLSHLSPQRGILRSERNKERHLFVLLFRSGRRSICVDSQLLLNSSISCYSLICVTC